MKKIKLILIAGGTASGKTEIALKLEESLKQSGLSASTIFIDYYYKPITEFKVKDNDKVNWDEPKAINWIDLKNDLNKILNNETVKRNVYDFNTSTYIENEFKTFEPTEYIILEGIFALFDKDIVKKSYSKIFVHADSDIRLIRRTLRDQNKRYDNFDINVFFTKWTKFISPMHKQYIEPSKYNSDLIIMNNKNSKENLEGIIKNITSFVKEN